MTRSPNHPDLPAAVDRLRQMRENLTGAKAGRLRQDRRALDVVIEHFDGPAVTPGAPNPDLEAINGRLA